MRVWPRMEGLRAFTLGTAGEMRDRLNALVLTGQKMATAGLWRAEYESDGEAVETVGERQVMLDSNRQPLALIEIVRVEVHAFSSVSWEFAGSEGEGFTSIEDWREGHRSYYAEHGVEVHDDEPVVCTWFRVVERLDRPELEPGRIY